MPRQTIHDPITYLALARLMKDHNINLSQSQISVSLICPQRTVSNGLAKARKVLEDEDGAENDAPVVTDDTNNAKDPKASRKSNHSPLNGHHGQKQTKRKARDTTDDANDEDNEKVAAPKLKKARAGKSSPVRKAVVKSEPAEEDNGVIQAEAEGV